MRTFDPKDRRTRFALLLPFGALSLAALALLAVSPGASGAANEFGYPDSLPPIGGVIFAVPSLAFALAAAAVAWKRTSIGYSLIGRRMLLGLLPLLAAMGMLIYYAFAIDDASSYRGKFNEVTHRYDPMLSQGQFIEFTAGIAVLVPMGAFAIAFKLLYLDGIEPYKRDEPEGTDPMGEILRSSGLSHPDGR